LAVLSESEIGQLEVAFFVDEDILWLQIAVNDVEGMQVLEHQGNLGGIEPKIQQV